MGNMIWHEYARFTCITASVYAVWAGYWGIFYRKFFWDFVDGTLRDPGGLQPGPSGAPFAAIIVKAPVIPIFAMVLGMLLIAIEWPLPLFKNTSIHRNFTVRMLLLLFQTFLNILYYQGTNAAIWSFIAALCYWRAIKLGEKMPEAKENRARGGGV